MDLFAYASDISENLLTKDGQVNYYGPILSLEESDNFLSRVLRNIAWTPDEAIIMSNTFSPNVLSHGMRIRRLNYLFENHQASFALDTEFT
ncbi:hypothetical protein [Nitrosomonas supralitoralis]|uniref:hypothetical protein n=1 Tax=Nitrosomonas supralitoralis TaxID=2116706 RepID=UPI0018D56DDE|nr:hypothetical protein [Nitrosomonas supralitoralis]